MKLINIIRIWHDYNDMVFASMYMPLDDKRHTKTRSKSYWAAWDYDNDCYIWNYAHHENMRSIIFHEMVHQWQDEYLPPYLTDQNPHDIYFWGWQPTAIKLGLDFAEVF